MTGNAAKLAELAKEIAVCERCDLFKTANRAVPGEGPADAELVFIGEAPGFQEDRTGRPFVGPAGQLLEDMLKSVGMKRSDVFICNVVKHRPPNNRDPLPAEIEACRPWLEQQLALLDPLVICTLGRYSMQRYFSGTISRIHGKAQKIGNRWVLPLYHPAAALHNQGLRPQLFADFAQIPDLLDHARQERQAARTESSSATAKQEPKEPPASQGRLF